MVSVTQPVPYLPGLSNRARIEMFGTPRSVRSIDVGADIPQTPVLQDGRRQAVKCHPELVNHFVDTCVEAHRRSMYRPKRMDSHVIRLIRGSSSVYSSHSWATAWDIFSTPADVPPPGGVWTPDAHFSKNSKLAPAALSIERNFADFVEVFLENGFWWGGFFRRKTKPRGQSRGPAGMDTPHFEWRSKLPLGAPVKKTSPVPGVWKRGSSGPDVAFVQTLMREKLGIAVESDGVFGPKTEQAVLEARRILGMQQVKTVTLKMISALKAYKPSTQAGATPPKLPAPPKVNTPDKTPNVSQGHTAALRQISEIVGKALDS